MTAEPREGRPVRVLYYDDNRDLGEAVQLYLNDLGYAVRAVSRFREARAALAEERFDVAVIDWVTPNDSGPELLKLLREKTPQTRRIVYSARSLADAECTALGAEAFVRKGADTEPLRLAIVRAVARPILPDERPAAPFWADAFPAEFAKLDRCGERRLIGVIASDGIVPDSLAAALAEWCWNAKPNVALVGTDCQDWSDNECEVRLRGRVVPGPQPQFERGLLDRAEGVRFVLDRADAMPGHGQRSLHLAVERQSITRVGAEAEIPTVIGGIVATEPDRFKRLSGPLRAAIRDCTLDFCLDAKDPAGVLDSWIRAIAGPLPTVSPGLQAAVHSLRIRPTLQDADRLIRTKPTWAAVGELHGEHMGLSLLERCLTSTSEKPWPSLGDAEKFARTYYVCRLLGETGGNVKEAADLAQVSRQTLHNLIRDQQIDMRYFDRSSTGNAASR